MSPGDVTLFDVFAPAYDWVMPPADGESLLVGLDRAQRPVRRVVDVGGGTGRGVRALDVAEGIVVDPATGMLQRAREHGLTAIRGDGASVPLGTATVDAVLVVDALHHVLDQQGVLEEGYRILRPGGILVVREFDPTTVRGRLLTLGERAVGFDSTFHDPVTLRDAMTEAGFDATIAELGFGYTVAGVKTRHE